MARMQRAGRRVADGSVGDGNLFQRGSTGDPKGVMLSHFNIMANIRQVSQVFMLDGRDKILWDSSIFSFLRVYRRIVAASRAGRWSGLSIPIRLMRR